MINKDATENAPKATTLETGAPAGMNWPIWPLAPLPEAMQERLPELAALSKQSLTTTRWWATKARDVVAEQLLDGNGAHGPMAEVMKPWNAMARHWMDVIFTTQDAMLETYERQVHHLIDQSVELTQQRGRHRR